MTTSLKYFMLIAQEQSIVRAAEQLYISPQNLSSHVKRLEKEYGVLFNRYPHFSLTPSGEALLYTLRQINILEQGLDDHLKEIQEKAVRHLDFGIHPLRGRIILPRVLATFKKKFPDVHITLHYQNVEDCEKMLLNGDIDAFFGFHIAPIPEFKVIPLENEHTFFVATDSMLAEYGVTPVNGQLAFRDLPRFPFLLSPKSSRARQKIDLFCREMGIEIDESISVSDFELQLILASQNMGACFTPKTILSKMTELNQTMPDGNKLRAFRVENLTTTNDLSIFVHRMKFVSKPLKGLIQAFQTEFEKGF